MCDGGACVMVVRYDNSVVLGNTSQHDGPVYPYTRTEWRDFVAGAKLGEFDMIA